MSRCRCLTILVISLLIVIACARLIQMRPTANDWEPEVAPATRIATPARVACANSNPLRQAYFGDLHIHTGLSADAMLFGTVNRPADAYRFARGEDILLRRTSPGAVPLAEPRTR